MRVSDEGIELIKQHEGLRLKAYPDPATNGDPWTIGYGSTSGVHEGLTITQEEADERLRNDLKTAELCIGRYVKAELTQHQFDALASLIFNIGCGNFASSTLLKLVNRGNFTEAADQFPRWNKAAGKVMAGLTKRREAEREHFLA